MLESEKRLHYELIKEVFILAYKDECNMEAFIKSFMQSDIAEPFFKNCTTHYFNPYNIFIDIKEKYHIDKTSKKYLENFISYIAFIYSKFYLRTYESPKQIYSYLPFSYLEKNFDHFHLLSEERVIFIAKEFYNLRNNPMRMIRSKNNANVFDVSEKESLFVARDIFNNLFYYPEIEKLEYRYDKLGYFIDSNTFLISKNVSSQKDIIDFINDDEYKDYKFNKANNIACLFLRNIKAQELDINKIIEINNMGVPFDKILLILNRNIIFISGTIVNNYYYVYTQNELERSLLKYNNRFLTN